MNKQTSKYERYRHGRGMYVVCVCVCERELHTCAHLDRYT